MKNIQDVLKRLEQIIAWSIEHQSPAGYFAALYYRMTQAVADGIQNGAFEDAARMDQLDVVFAQRYIHAFEQWQAGQKTSQVWHLAFNATALPDITVLQHLLLGVNAHINLDLGMAAAQIRPGESIYSLKNDFQQINQIIEGLVNEVQDHLASIWLPFKWIDWLLRTADEGWINFSIKVSRTSAWNSAILLAQAPDAMALETLAAPIDEGATWLGQRVQNPGFLLRTGLWWMRRGEKGSVADKIQMLLKKPNHA
jgi:hypothetical protein